jgi:ketosteroid isomerase-like protein
MMPPSRTLKYLAAYALVCWSLALTGSGSAQAADAEAKAVIKSWLQAVVSGDKEGIGAVLAPEFQILRSNGVGHGKDAYASGGAARIHSILDVTDVIATRHENLLITRYKLAVTETIDGHKVQQKAPRLTVFRRAGNRWLVVAHANFARIEK